MTLAVALLNGTAPRGQFVIVDPEKKMVLVQTSLRDGNEQELYALWAALSSQLP